jgi:DNA-binding IclR family transcriptional regulator
VTRRDVRFGYLNDARVWYAEQVHGPHPLAAFSAAATLPAHATAIGQALLAFSASAVVSYVTNRGLTRYTPSTPTTAMTLGRALSAARLRGVAVVNGHLSPDHAAVAAPVFGPGRQILAALEVRLHSIPEELRDVVPALTVAARGLSRELAHVPPGDADSISMGSIGSGAIGAWALDSRATVVSLDDQQAVRRRRDGVHGRDVGDHRESSG